MKKRDKKITLSRETVRDLTTPQVKVVVGGAEGGEEIDATCIPGGTTHWPNAC